MSTPLKTAILAHLDAHPRRLQQTIADKLNIHRTKLSHLVSGKRKPTRRERARLAEFLAKPEHELFPEVSE